MNTVWVERLGVFDLLRLTLRPNTLVRYDEHRASRTSALVLRILERLKIARFSPANLDFNKLDRDGFALLYRMQDELNACLDSALARTGSMEPRWYRDAALFYLREKLEPSFIFLVSAQAAIGEDETRRHSFYATRGPVSDLFVEYQASRGVSVELSLHLAPTVKSCLFPAALLAAFGAARLLPDPARDSSLGGKPAIWVEYYPTRVFDYAFWRGFVSDAKIDLVQYFSRSDTPVTDAALEELRSNGFKWIDLHPFHYIRASNAPFGDILNHARGLLDGEAPFWHRSFDFQCKTWLTALTALYRRFSVKLLLQREDRSWKQAVEARALELSGGMMLGYHWSNLVYCPRDWFLTSQHVYFVWGSIAREALEKKGHSCRRILPSGCWIVPDGREIPKALADFRKRRRFIVAVYDSTAAYDLYQSPATLSLFFLKILDLLENNPEWGALIKCKDADIGAYARHLPKGAEIARRLQVLEAGDRLLVADPRLSSATLTRCSDLAVCYTFNTAGVIASINGGSAVHWDCVGLKHPLLEQPGQQVVYKNLEDLGGAVIERSRGDLAIGDLSIWRTPFDYFADHQAPRRIGAFIQSYMDELTKSESVAKAVDRAADSYLKENAVSPAFFDEKFWR